MSRGDDYDDYPDLAPAARETRQQPWALPLTILAAALLVALATETVQLADEHWRLVALGAALTPQVQQSVKFRNQLQALGSETARLADGGDAAAKKIVEAMQQQGVTLKLGENK
jgi:hypothetical protein